MRRSLILLLVITVGVSLLIAGKFWNRANVDWIALYEQKLGRPIEELSEAPLVARLEAEDWTQPGITIAGLKDGTTLLLGLPQAYRPSPEHIVEKTIVLDMEDAKQRCEESLEPKQYGWIWHSSVEEETNTFQINPVPVRSEEEIRLLDSDPFRRESYCELEFVDKWQLNVVNPVGVIEAAP